MGAAGCRERHQHVCIQPKHRLCIQLPHSELGVGVHPVWVVGIEGAAGRVQRLYLPHCCVGNLGEFVPHSSGYTLANQGKKLLRVLVHTQASPSDQQALCVFIVTGVGDINLSK